MKGSHPQRGLSRFGDLFSGSNSGIGYMILSVIFYVAGDLFIKDRLKGIPSIEVVLFRNLFGLLFLFTARYSQPLILVGERFWLLLSRGIFGFLSLALFYYLIAHAPLANAVVFLQAATIFSAIIAFCVNEEKLNWLQATGTVVGFAGICFVVNPTISVSVNDLLGIALGVVSALALTSIKELKKYYDSRSIVFSYLVVGVALPAICMSLGSFLPTDSFGFISAKFVIPNLQSLQFLVAVAVLTTIGQLYKTKAYALSKAGIIGTIGYSRIAFALAAGILLGDAYPKPITLAGIVLITAAAIMVSQDSREGGR